MVNNKDENIRELIPKDKRDLDRARLVVERGYPAVAPIMSELLEWIQDYNWPVAKVLAPFLASIGEPLLPNIRHILSTTDDAWKYWVLTLIVAKSSPLAEQLRPELTRFRQSPTPSEVAEELPILAQEILENLSGTT